MFANSFTQHLERLESVFGKLKAANLKLRAGKYFMFQMKIKCLGHIVSVDGVETDPDKIEVVKSWPVPKSVSDVKRFLGFVGYYGRFINHFSCIARPLHDLLKQPDNHRKRKSATSIFEWGPEQRTAFDKLIDACCSAPILGFADYSLQFTLHTDASAQGLGAVLYQEQDGKQRVIADASRSLNRP